MRKSAVRSVVSLGPFTLPNLEQLHISFYAGVLNTTFWNKGVMRPVLDKPQFAAVLGAMGAWESLAPRLYDHVEKCFPCGMTFKAFVNVMSIICLGNINSRLALLAVVHQGDNHAIANMIKEDDDENTTEASQVTEMAVSHDEFARLWESMSELLGQDAELEMAFNECVAVAVLLATKKEALPSIIRPDPTPKLQSDPSNNNTNTTTTDTDTTPATSTETTQDQDDVEAVNTNTSDGMSNTKIPRQSPTRIQEVTGEDALIQRGRNSLTFKILRAAVLSQPALVQFFDTPIPILNLGAI